MTETTILPLQAKADEAAAGLRELADFIEREPDFADVYWGGHAVLYVPPGDGAADRFRDLVRRLGGHRTKSEDDQHIKVIRRFGPISIKVFTHRELVCERVVVGTEKVEVPDPDAPFVTVEREVVEWKCSPILDDVEDSS